MNQTTGPAGTVVVSCVDVEVPRTTGVPLSIVVRTFYSTAPPTDVQENVTGEFRFALFAGAIVCGDAVGHPAVGPAAAKGASNDETSAHPLPVAITHHSTVPAGTLAT